MLSWDIGAWEEYLFWQTEDKKTIKKINIIIQDTIRNPFSGIGKPEPLKGRLGGLWSRRIDDKNRLLYRVVGYDIQIISCKGHYGDR